MKIKGYNIFNGVKIYKIASLIIFFLAAALVLVPSAGALEVRSGNSVTVDSPIDDDVLVSGGTVDIKAPVNGLIVAGGSVIIEAPVKGDVVAAGGSILINSDVGGKILAVGGSIDFKGSVKNLVAAGGSVNIDSGAVVTKDALVSGGTVTNKGKISGNLKVSAQNFENLGSAGRVNYSQYESPQGVGQGFWKVIGVISFVWIIGSLILGLVLLTLLPMQFLRVRENMRVSTLTKAATGFVLIIATMVFIFLAAITIVGVPVAMMSFALLVIALILANYFVAFTLGKKIAEFFKFNTGNIAEFIIGFIVLSILLAMPLLGGLVQIITSSLGFGSIYYTLRDNWGKMAKI